MLNFCLPETVLKKIVIELQNKGQNLEKELNETNLLINKILTLQQVDLIQSSNNKEKNNNKEIKLPEKEK